MTRKQLEIELAYAERERVYGIGIQRTVEETIFVAASPTGKTLPVETVDRPDWLKDGSTILNGQEAWTVVIGNERVCLVTREETGQKVWADTSVLVARWQAANGISSPIAA